MLLLLLLQQQRKITAQIKQCTVVLFIYFFFIFFIFCVCFFFVNSHGSAHKTKGNSATLEMYTHYHPLETNAIRLAYALCALEKLITR